MALKIPPSRSVISLTQGSADAFVQGSVATGLTGSTGNLCFNAKAFGFALALASRTALTAVSTYDICVAITRRSKSVFPEMSDPDVMWMWSLEQVFVTSGCSNYSTVVTFKPETDVPIVEETIYAQLDSAGTGLSLVGYATLDLEQDTMSAVDRLTLVARSLAD